MIISIILSIVFICATIFLCRNIYTRDTNKPIGMNRFQLITFVILYIIPIVNIVAFLSFILFNIMRIYTEEDRYIEIHSDKFNKIIEFFKKEI